VSRRTNGARGTEKAHMAVEAPQLTDSEARRIVSLPSMCTPLANKAGRAIAAALTNGEWSELAGWLAANLPEKDRANLARAATATGRSDQ
jgi:hypothetical protein